MNTSFILNTNVITQNKHIKNKQWIFRIIAILLPFVFLLFVEIILRLSNYGYNTNLFIENNTGEYFYLNPEISQKYFTISENATIGNVEYFQKEKDSTTIRLFVLGASSSVGFPYMHNGAFPRMLKYRLQLEYPDMNFEIINLSLTAINSYTLYDFSKQIIHYEPDGILIYAGHNEYYGALGVASTSTIGTSTFWTRTTLVLKNLKLGQWIFNLGTQLKGTDKKLTDYSLTLMERMIEEQSIPYDSKLFWRGIGQFESNMTDLLNLFHKNQIPVYISSLVYNQKDLKPFISSTDNKSADKQYQLGNADYLKENYTSAKEHYILAKEYDELRFRAPEKINELITRFSQEIEQVYFVNSLAAFEKYSPHSILDSTLLLEHVHPNLEGHRLIADAFYEKLKETEILQGKSNSQSMLSLSDYPYTAYDTIFGQISIWLLKELWPFNEPIPEEDPAYVRSWVEEVAGATAVKQINWLDAMNYLYEYYREQNDIENALRIMEGLCLEYPYSADYFQSAEQLSRLLGNKEKADFYLIKAKQLRTKRK